MQIVIKLDKRLYEYAKQHTLTSSEIDEICDAIANGMSLPKGHGDLIDKEHMITRLENSGAYFDCLCADIFDRRYGQGLKEAAIKVSEEKAVIPADKEDTDGTESDK